MHFSLYKWFILGAFLLIYTEPLYGQNQVSKNQLSIWGGYSFNSISFLGKTSNAKTQIFALGYQRRIKELSNSRTLWYSADVIPYLHFFYPKRDEKGRMVNRSGFGIAPFGFKITQVTDYIFTPYIQATGGMVYMNEYFPTDRAQRLNYTFDITVGTHFPLNSLFAISLGYKFHHISNAETGYENPGLDSNFLFLTFSIN